MKGEFGPRTRGGSFGGNVENVVEANDNQNNLKNLTKGSRDRDGFPCQGTVCLTLTYVSHIQSHRVWLFSVSRSISRCLDAIWGKCQRACRQFALTDTQIHEQMSGCMRHWFCHGDLSVVSAQCLAFRKCCQAAMRCAEVRCGMGKGWIASFSLTCSSGLQCFPLRGPCGSCSASRRARPPLPKCNSVGANFML